MTLCQFHLELVNKWLNVAVPQHQANHLKWGPKDPFNGLRFLWLNAPRASHFLQAHWQWHGTFMAHYAGDSLPRGSGVFSTFIFTLHSLYVRLSLPARLTLPIPSFQTSIHRNWRPGLWWQRHWLSANPVHAGLERERRGWGPPLVAHVRVRWLLLRGR